MAIKETSIKKQNNSKKFILIELYLLLLVSAPFYAPYLFEVFNSTQETGNLDVLKYISNSNKESKISNLKIGDTTTSLDLAVTINSIYAKTSYIYTDKFTGQKKDYSAKKGNLFVIANVEIKNIGSEVIKYSGYNSPFSVIDSEGHRYNHYSNIQTIDNKLVSYKELYPNEKINGLVLFEVPISAKGLKLLYKFDDSKIASWIVGSLRRIN